eukprot:TRINITY_DN5841_c0_g1_i1.p1 TRINITY_DN5841_c0_g1~~TRINITY_DN5841_c0_g1_i1.p1  ORF type:complete len:110 (-),score=32.05 TRINITY_DN5841_c0_g1_i1:16-345(-)
MSTQVFAEESKLGIDLPQAEQASISAAQAVKKDKRNDGGQSLETDGVHYVRSADGSTLELDKKVVEVTEDDPAIVIHWSTEPLLGIVGALQANRPPVQHVDVWRTWSFI